MHGMSCCPAVLLHFCRSTGLSSRRTALETSCSPPWQYQQQQQPHQELPCCQQACSASTPSKCSAGLVEAGRSAPPPLLTCLTPPCLRPAPPTWAASGGRGCLLAHSWMTQGQRVRGPSVAGVVACSWAEPRPCWEEGICRCSAAHTAWSWGRPARSITGVCVVGGVWRADVRLAAATASLSWA